MINEVLKWQYCTHTHTHTRTHTNTDERGLYSLWPGWPTSNNSKLNSLGLVVVVSHISLAWWNGSSAIHCVFFFNCMSSPLNKPQACWWAMTIHCILISALNTFLFKPTSLKTTRHTANRGGTRPDRTGSDRTAAQRLLASWVCFTSTETVGLLGTGAQEGHLDFHTAPELWGAAVNCDWQAIELAPATGYWHTPRGTGGWHY